MNQASKIGANGLLSIEFDFVYSVYTDQSTKIGSRTLSAVTGNAIARNVIRE